MINRIRLLFVAFSAVAVLGAVASATASAESPLFLPERTEAYTGKGGAGTLAVLPGGITKEIMAKEVETSGTLEAGAKLGSFHIDFKKSTAGGGLLTCTGLGEASGVVLMLGTWHLVYDKLGTGGELGVAFLFLAEATHLECGSKLFVMTGQVLCLLSPVETLTTSFTVKCEGSKGDPKETVYWNEKGEEVKLGESGLLDAENEGTGEMTSLNTEAKLETKSTFLLMG